MENFGCKCQIKYDKNYKLVNTLPTLYRCAPLSKGIHFNSMSGILKKNSIDSQCDQEVFHRSMDIQLSKMGKIMQAFNIKTFA